MPGRGVASQLPGLVSGKHVPGWGVVAIEAKSPWSFGLKTGSSEALGCVSESQGTG